MAVAQRAFDGRRVGWIAQDKLRVEFGGVGDAGRVVVGFDLHGFDVRARLGGELHGTEYAVQPPEILVFQPGCARIFVAGDGERVLGRGGSGGGFGGGGTVCRTA